ncbi:viral protein 2 [Sorex coronatus polyomavirus 1]|uniref:Minor capsid protein n=2 Tax=Sorex coronatus polyomavirus 1 TaxID=2560770 RepID=A0A223PYL7_9POLY|nr:viral protein 2 [Sorex coronatus polyomavirus 1]ASU50419.1 viral protein 2 [Sorex coronatus polyomavirus 1]ASU50424.1 viral protein 2 [Sorex coronatus polyomavirus 1]
MGGVISLAVELAGAISALVAATDLTAEAILAGEALAAIESEVASMVLVEGFAEADALAALGLTAEHMSMLSAIPGMVEQLASTGLLVQTLSGAAALFTAGIKLSQHEVSLVNRNMALQLWRPDLWELILPGFRHFEWGFDVLGGWGHSLVNAVGRLVWQMVLSESRRRLGMLGGNLIGQGGRQAAEQVAQLLEGARWVVTAPYSSLQHYYRSLPPMNVIQMRQQARLRGQKLIDYDRTEETDPESGEVIQKYGPPGGADQPVTPDWMLLMILGLYGDITPLWGHVLEQEHILAPKNMIEGPPAKKRRKM